MAIIPSRYPLDLTGQSPENYIEGEIRQLPTKKIRCIAPFYGPFYTATLTIRDASNQRLLERGVDYQCLDLNDIATLKSHQEVCSIIAIINEQVNPEIDISYRVVGGEYENSHTAIVPLIEALINDNRPVAWPNLLNKPNAFVPSPHLTAIDDIYGFENLILSLESLRKTLLFGDQAHSDKVIKYIEDILFNFNTQMVRLLDTYEREKIENAVTVSEQARINSITALNNAALALQTINSVKAQRDEIAVLARMLEQNAYDSEQKARAIVRENKYLLM